MVMTAAAYVAHYHVGNAVMADLLDSLTQSRRQLPGTSPSPSKRAAYQAHMRPSAVETAISDGSLLQVFDISVENLLQHLCASSVG